MKPLEPLLRSRWFWCVAYPLTTAAVALALYPDHGADKWKLYPFFLGFGTLLFPLYVLVGIFGYQAAESWRLEYLGSSGGIYILISGHLIFLGVFFTGQVRLRTMSTRWLGGYVAFLTACALLAVSSCAKVPIKM